MQASSFAFFLAPLAFASCSSAAVSSSVLPGYVDTLARSRFAIGTLVGTQDVAGMHEMIGDEGVFAAEIVSGMVIATSNADSADLVSGPYPGTADLQNEVVVGYFEAAGLEPDQVGQVTATSGFEALVSADSPIPNQNVLLTWVDTIICREFDGIKISDSFAWASLDASGKSVSESVYWPELPASTMAAVAAFQALLADQTERDAFLANLPAGISNGELVIHYTPGEAINFSAVPYFDVSVEGVTLHFDMNGHLQTLPGSESPCP
jgi:hypothetical protein